MYTSQNRFIYLINPYLSQTIAFLCGVVKLTSGSSSDFISQMISENTFLIFAEPTNISKGFISAKR